MNTVTVELGQRSYTILIQEQLLDNAGSCILNVHTPCTAAIITNPTIAPLYSSRLKSTRENSGFKTNIIELPDGEQHKNLAQMQHVYSAVLAAALDRNSLLIALGGGVIGDITGFAAATYMRGVPFIQIPTTLLAQVDSSIGGKTGVNLVEGKNLVGAFHQPLMVIIDPNVLKTLPARELKSGFAEVIKSAIIHDAFFFKFLENHASDVAGTDINVLLSVITTCCRIKAAITSQDETETGIRALLNFGHTIGHAIENLTGYGTYTHGEAVAIGMSTIARLSWKMSFCSKSDSDRIFSLLTNAGLPTALPFFPVDAYVDAILKDKKKISKAIKMVFLKKIGSVFLRPITANEMHELLSKEFKL
jgi:3-dehydroquinate synthase